MRAVVETIAGREVRLSLTLDDLDLVAAVNPQFEEVLRAFDLPVWDWREVRAILTGALSGTGVTLQQLYDERDVGACRDLAKAVWSAAMPKAAAGNAEAVAAGDRVVSTSPPSSATA